MVVDTTTPEVIHFRPSTRYLIFWLPPEVDDETEKGHSNTVSDGRNVYTTCLGDAMIRLFNDDETIQSVCVARVTGAERERESFGFYLSILVEGSSLPPGSK